MGPAFARETSLATESAARVHPHLTLSLEGEGIRQATASSGALPRTSLQSPP